MITVKKTPQQTVWQKKHVPQKKKKFDLELYLIDMEDAWFRNLKKLLKKHKALKFDIKVTVRLQKLQSQKTFIYSTPCFRSANAAILGIPSILPALRKMKETILDAYDCFMKEGSGWTLNRVEFSEISVYAFPMRVGGGGKKQRSSFSLPKNFRGFNRKNLVSFAPTKDGRCFLYCILARLYPPKKSKINDPRHYIVTGKINRLNTEGLSFPTPLSEISLFEGRNNLIINVIGLKGDGTHYFLYKSPRQSGEQVNLLLHRRHYHLIKCWTPFFKSKSNTRYLCEECGKLCLPSLMMKKKQCLNCMEPPVSQLVFPSKGTKQKFNGFSKTVLSPFVLYCDLETALSPTKEESEGKTKKLKEHKPIAIGLMRICQNEGFSHNAPVIHVGEDCIERFYESLIQELDFIENTLTKINYPLDMGVEDEKNFRASQECYVCGLKFEKTSKKCRDHDHLKEKANYRGAICNPCNLSRTDSRLKTPLFFHNGGRFDVHFILQKMHKLHLPNSTNVIAKTGENFMCLELFDKRLIIKDSFNHLSSSLAALVEQLKMGGKGLKITSRFLKEDKEKIELMTRKGVFPYSMVDGLKILEETTQLPSKDLFYDTLREKSISEEDYYHARRVWNLLKCRNLKEYMIHYLATDITLLADVMENYRKFFHSKFGLDPTHYLSLPGLSYDCMLRFTKCEIELVSNIETYSFIKRSLRGGVSMIPHRWARANNPLMGRNFYDPTQPTTYLIYVDCNSLYSSVMTKALPFRNLRWIKKTREWVLQKTENYRAEDSTGYLVECDLEYPPSIHDITKDLPLAPEHIKITKEMLSPFCLKLSQELNIKMDGGSKLVSTQLDKKNYVCHIENLQFYLKWGMKLTQVHRILCFEQSPFLRPYIELCINQRRAATSPDEKTMWKLACNAIFGKTITNLEKRHNVKIHTNETKVRKAVSSPLFKHADVITDRVVQTTSYKRKNKMNTPYFVGVSILELSKLHLMKLHYDHFLSRYGIFRLQLCMTDTDSLLYYIKTENVYDDLQEMNIVDFSNYPPDHALFDNRRGGELFLLKDETGGTPIKSFVGLRAKSYSIQFTDKTSKVTGKGVPKHKLKEITHEDLEKTLKDTIPKNITSEYLRSFKHKVYTISQQKTALSAYDNKRFVKDDGITTLPIGHIDTR